MNPRLDGMYPVFHLDSWLQIHPITHLCYQVLYCGQQPPKMELQSATYNINIVEDGFLKGLLTGTSRPYPPTGYYPSYDSTDLNSNVILYLADAGTNNYGLGQYTTNSSSYQDGFDTRYILDNSSTSVWQSGAFTYELYTGIPSSTAAQTSYYPTTSSTTLNTISGEYVTLQLPVSVSPTTFSIQANTFNLLNSPSQVLILGSTDGLTWILLTDPGLLDFTTSTNAILNISVPISIYRYLLQLLSYCREKCIDWCHIY